MPPIASITRHESHRTRSYILAVAGIAAIAAVGILASILSSPDTLVRLATRSLIDAAPREAKVTVSATGDIVVPAAEALAVQPAVASGDRSVVATAAFSVGDRMTITSSDGKQRVLEVIEVTNDSAPKRGGYSESNTHLSNNLAVVTCRVLDSSGPQARSEVIRFVVPTGASQHPLPVSYPAMNAPAPRLL